MQLFTHLHCFILKNTKMIMQTHLICIFTQQLGVFKVKWRVAKYGVP